MGGLNPSLRLTAGPFAVVVVVGFDFVMAIPIGLALYNGFRSINPFKPICKPFCFANPFEFDHSL